MKARALSKVTHSKYYVPFKWVILPLNKLSQPVIYKKLSIEHLKQYFGNCYCYRWGHSHSDGANNKFILSRKTNNSDLKAEHNS